MEVDGRKPRETVRKDTMKSMMDRERPMNYDFTGVLKCLTRVMFNEGVEDQ